MAKEYRKMSEAEVPDLADRLIEAYHHHLKGVKIEFLWFTDSSDDAKRKKGQKITMGEAWMPDAKLAVFTRAVFMIALNKPQWAKRGDDHNEVTLDHELCHCAWDKDKGLHIRKHEIEDFPEIVNRHGATTLSQRRYEAGLLQQLDLFDEGQRDMEQAAARMAKDGVTITAKLSRFPEPAAAGAQG